MRPTVFISYAHESDALRASVKALADWLGNQGCTVLTDHPYVHRPPEQGWPVWMHDCVREADVVLVVCTPKLKARYEKNEEPGTGRGATFEGAIITQHLYENAMRNTKFYPVLPDEDGREVDIPTTLKAWWNGHRFPSGYEGIRCMIFNEQPDDRLSQSDAGANPSGWVPDSLHQQLAARLLGATGAGPFVAALKAELTEAFPLDSAPQTPPDIVRWFIQSATEGEEIESLFDAVHAALIKLEEAIELDVPTRRDIEEAAAAMYCLAACLSVDRAAHNAGEFVIRVPRTESIICAIIATALFGGELRLRPTEDAELPGVEYVLSVPLPPTGPRAEEDFERNAYVALFWGHSKGPQEALDSGPLSEDQRQALIVRLRRIRKREKRSLALVVRGTADGEPFRRFAKAYSVPVMVPGDDAATALFRIPAARLRAHIQEFWASIRVLRGPGAQPAAASHPLPGGQPMSSPSQHFHFYRDGAVSTGSHSVTQAGTQHTAHLDHRQGADLAVVVPLLQDLVREIDMLTSAKARDTLAVHAAAAEAEAVKEKPDPGRIKTALEAIKSGAAVLEDGGKIITLCNKAYRLVAPLLGLPPSPLP